MTAVTVTTGSGTVVAASHATQFIHLHNASAQTVYLNYDGGAATVADGFPLLTGARIELDGPAKCCKGVRAIVSATTADLRVQVG